MIRPCIRKTENAVSSGLRAADSTTLFCANFPGSALNPKEFLVKAHPGNRFIFMT
jgi:hypothetical protein